MGKRILVVPDAHAHPEYDNERFSLLAKFIQQTKPDEVWCLGDFADMPSLGHHDRGKISFEGRRYTDDVRCTVDAQKRLWGRRYKGKRILMRGNHDCDNGRHGKLVSENPELSGTIKVSDLKYEEYWDEIYPFKTVANLDGVAVSHYFPSGVMARPIGGENAAKTLLKKNMASSIAGHSHTYDIALVSDVFGNKRFGLVAGCFTHPDYTEGWCANTTHLWDRCVTLLEGVSKGSLSSVRRIDMEDM